MVVVESAILRRGSGDSIPMTYDPEKYDPEKAYDFVTGEGNQPIPRERAKPFLFPNKPIFPTRDAIFDGFEERPSLWERFLDWWVG